MRKSSLDELKKNPELDDELECSRDFLSPPQLQYTLLRVREEPTFVVSYFVGGGGGRKVKIELYCLWFSEENL